MLLLADGTVVYSASDLATAATCEFALLRTLDAKLGRIAAAEITRDAMLVRLAALGDRHERGILAELRHRHGHWDPAAGRGVVEIARPRGADARDPAVLAAKRDETLAALRAGADAVYQAGFFDGRLSGWADFVVRDDDGAPGAPVYTVQDAKLARRAKATALAQLAAYADQLIVSGIRVSDHVHLVLGDCSLTDHLLADLLPAHRELRAWLQAILDAHVAEDAPVAWGDERYTACLTCDVCAPEVESHRDVLLVAGLHAAQRLRLRDADVPTIDRLAAGDGAVPGIRSAALETLRAQARLQVAQDPPPGEPAPVSATGTGAASSSASPPASPTGTGFGVAGGLHFELFAPDVVRQLPPPDPGDVFFDFESDPLWADDAGVWGLEYLFGLVEAPVAPGDDPVFRTFWAHNRAQERQALLDFLEYVQRRRAARPGMHIYHYATYERTALRRLAERHGVGKEQVEALVRDGVLVDLYRVVRSCLRVGTRSYSLKRLEPMYMEVARFGQVQTAGESVAAYAEACDARDAGRAAEWMERLQRIAEYNAYDCLSTLGLRDWLMESAAKAGGGPA
jgi:predicted RecB family nuclease